MQNVFQQIDLSSYFCATLNSLGCIIDKNIHFKALIILMEILRRRRCPNVLQMHFRLLINGIWRSVKKTETVVRWSTYFIRRSKVSWA